MAKARSIVKISGNVDGITFVDSKAYGLHTRAIRGSKTPITLADGMKVSSTNQNEANLRAKIIFDAVNEFAPGFKNGPFWSRLVSFFRRQKKEGKSYSYADFHDLEMRWDYPTSKHGKFSLSAEGSSARLKYYLKADTGYSLSLLRIAADQMLLNPYPTETSKIEVNAGELNGATQFDFTPLPEQTPMLYVLLCEQLKEGKPTGLLRAKGMKFFKG
jgi:hypothetical protein